MLPWVDFPLDIVLEAPSRLSGGKMKLRQAKEQERDRTTVPEGGSGSGSGRVDGGLRTWAIRRREKTTPHAFTCQACRDSKVRGWTRGQDSVTRGHSRTHTLITLIPTHAPTHPKLSLSVNALETSPGKSTTRREGGGGGVRREGTRKDFNKWSRGDKYS